MLFQFGNPSILLHLWANDERTASFYVLLALKPLQMGYFSEAYWCWDLTGTHPLCRQVGTTWLHKVSDKHSGVNGKEKCLAGKLQVAIGTNGYIAPSSLSWNAVYYISNQNKGFYILITTLIDYRFMLNIWTPRAHSEFPFTFIALTMKKR